MTQPPQVKEESRITEFYLYLARNMVPVGILVVLVIGGIITFLIQDMNRRHKAIEVQNPVKVKRDKKYYLE